MSDRSAGKSARKFIDRHFPVRPNLDQLRHQAKDLLRAVKQGDPAAVAELRQHHPRKIEPAAAKLADVQAALARSYGLASWPRLVNACRMTDAIWRGDVDTVRKLVLRAPGLLHESARGVADSNWGPPMSYAANVGQDAIIAMLRDLGAEDLQHAFDRACLQGQLETARHLHAMGARVVPGLVMGPCETLQADGLALLFELGAEFADQQGDRLAPIALLLQTYCRGPQGKHRCLKLVAERGVALPDTAPMAMHRGRIDLLEAHLRRDPQLCHRTFSHQEIYPSELGCHADHSFALHGTPLAGTTLPASAARPRCSAAWCRRLTFAVCSEMRSLRAFYWIGAPTPTRALRCASNCASCRTSPCTNTATSRRWLGESAFTTRDPMVTHG
ncbi:MAG TPA: hypothetical protein VNX60_10660 [Candidatus Acidoferrum sp.]|nr:hypothetical protein [Candidatus Acidoferrum sp.]